MEMRKKLAIILLAAATAMVATRAARTQTQANVADSAAAARGADTAAAAPLPKDVYAESRNRLPLPKREDVSDEDKKIFDEMTRHSQHPLPRLYDPPLARPMSEAGYYLKNETGLPSRLMEIAVLVTARQLDCQFEWTQWENDGRNASDPRHIEQSTIDLIKYNRPVVGLGEKETAIIAFGREMLGDKKVSSATFADVLRLFGPRLTVDLVELMAGYSACAPEMRAFDQQLNEGQTPLLPAGRSHAYVKVSSSAVPPAAASLPADVYPESRNRLPLPKREDMDDYGKAVFDELTHKPELPSVRLYDPKVAKPLAEAHRYIRYKAGLPDRMVEIAVLVTARERDCQYEWTEWEMHGRDLSDSRHIEPEIIDIIKYDRPVAGLGERETAVINLGRGMFGEERVSPATFAEVLRLFGRRGAVDLVELMTLHTATAAELTAFDEQLPEGQRPLMPVR